MAAVTCQEARELFSARVDDALTPEEQAQLDAHLATCAECAVEWQRFEGTVGLLRASAPARAPVGFVDRVLAARPLPWYRRLARGVLVPWPVKLPLDAAAIVLIAGLAIMIFQHSPELQQAARAPEAPAPTAAPARSQAPAPAEPHRGSAPAPPRGNDTPAAPPRSVTPTAPGSATTPTAPPLLTPPSTPSGAASSSTGAGSAVSSTPAAKGDRALPDEAKDRAAEQAPMALRKERFSSRDGGRAAEGEGLAEPRARKSEMPADGARQSAERDDRRAPAPPAGASVPPAPAPPAAASAPQKSGEVQRLSTFRIDVQARLAVGDREAAERAVRELVARAGGRVLARADESGTTVLVLAVPSQRWEDVRGGLQTLGALSLEGQGDAAARQLVLTLRLVR
jgi:hypothetical protein